MEYGKGDTPTVKTDEETGREFYEYPSGLTKWKDTGQFRTAPAITPVGLDPAGMQIKRNEKSKQVARNAIDQGAIDAGKLDPSKFGTGEGWFEIIRHTTETFLKSGNIRGMGEALTKLATVSGHITRDEQPEKGRGVYVENLNVGASILLDVIRGIEQDRKQAIDVLHEENNL